LISSLSKTGFPFHHRQLIFSFQNRVSFRCFQLIKGCLMSIVLKRPWVFCLSIQFRFKRKIHIEIDGSLFLFFRSDNFSPRMPCQSGIEMLCEMTGVDWSVSFRVETKTVFSIFAKSENDAKISKFLRNFVSRKFSFSRKFLFPRKFSRK
jgi:hypothetical protein